MIYTVFQHENVQEQFGTSGTRSFNNMATLSQIY